jgi:hypothetical protein
VGIFFGRFSAPFKHFYKKAGNKSACLLGFFLTSYRSDLCTASPPDMLTPPPPERFSICVVAAIDTLLPAAGEHKLPPPDAATAALLPVHKLRSHPSA